MYIRKIWYVVLNVPFSFCLFFILKSPIPFNPTLKEVWTNEVN